MKKTYIEKLFLYMVFILAIYGSVNLLIQIFTWSDNSLFNLSFESDTVMAPDSDTYAVPVETLSSSLITNDPLSKYQWGLKMMLGEMSYLDIQGNAPRDVVVAVIDSGVHMNHPDLVHKSVPGWNFIDGSADLRDTEWDEKTPNASNFHGECSASIIAAESGNGIGITGVFSRAYIMPLQTDLVHMADAINFAVDNEADVILIAGGLGEVMYPINGTDSLYPRAGLYTPDNLIAMKDIKSALEKSYTANIPIVTGVSNTGKYDFNFLSDDYRTIVAAPHNALGEVSVHTSFSYTFEVFAPGGSRTVLNNLDELSAEYPNDLVVRSPQADYDDPICAIGANQYSFLTLGSAAMPHVAGTVAIIKSFLPGATVEEVREILRKGQVPLTPSGNILEGVAGRISLEKIVSEIQRRITP